MFETDLTDQELLEQIVLFYRHRFQDYAPAQEYLLINMRFSAAGMNPTSGKEKLS